MFSTTGVPIIELSLLRYTLRKPIMELFALLLPKEEHKSIVKAFAASEDDVFARFLNNMMNDATMQLDEGMDTLIEIRNRERKKKLGEVGEEIATGSAGVGVDRGGIQDDERGENGEDMYR